MLAVLDTSPIKTFEDMINYAKKNPGKLSYATSAGVASVSTLNMEVVRNQAGVDITMVVYEGGGPSLTAILGGHVNIVASSIPALGPHIEAGKLRVLVTSKKTDELPGVRTLAELGFPMVVNWTGFFAPSRVPKGAYNILVKGFDKALENPEVIKKLKSAGYVPERKTPAEMTELLRQQHNLVSKIVKEAKLVK